MKIEVIHDGEIEARTKVFREELAAVREMEIDTDEDYQFAAEVLKHVAKNLKEVEELRKKVTKPLNDALSEYRKQYKPSTDALNLMKKILKEKIFQYEIREEEKTVAALAASAEAARAGDFEAAHNAAKDIKEATKAKGLSTRKTWDYEIVDASLVPREFLAVDHSLVTAYIKDSGKSKPKEVPGLKFVEKSIVTVRTA